MSSCDNAGYPTDASCKPIICSTTTPCAEGQVCKYGQCAYAECSSNSDCPKGQCVQGLCVGAKCTTDTDCSMISAGLGCKNGVCVAASCGDDSGCPDGTKCSNGYCIEKGYMGYFRWGKKTFIVLLMILLVSIIFIIGVSVHNHYSLHIWINMIKNAF